MFEKIICALKGHDLKHPGEKNSSDTNMFANIYRFKCNRCHEWQQDSFVKPFCYQEFYRQFRDSNQW